MMVRKLFLVSNFSAEFDNFAARFAEACGGRKAKIAFLMQGDKDWEEHFSLYQQSFRKIYPVKLYPIFPDEEYEFEQEMVKKLKKATGIFIGGGYAFRYILAYAQSELTPIIKEKYFSGIPYAGLSAGAVITMRLGLLPEIVLKPHFIEQNRFFELQKKLRRSKVEYGIGLDDGIWLEVENETKGIVFGKGNCYRCTKTENEEFEFKIYRPGDEIILKTE